MNTDLVTAHLTALARDNRRQLPSLDDTLRAIGAARSEPLSDRQGESAELALLAMARVFAHRVARAAAGGMTLACTIALLLVLWNPFDLQLGGEGFRRALGDHPWWTVIDHDSLFFGGVIVVLALVAHTIAVRIAERVFERSLRRGDGGLLERARAQLLLVDGWSVCLAIAGISAVAILFSVAHFVVGDENWLVFWDHGPEVGSSCTDRLRDLSIVIPVVIAASYAIGRACVDQTHESRLLRWLRARGVLPVALGLACATLVTGFAYDPGPYKYWCAGGAPFPSTLLRSALTGTGTVSIFLIVASSVVRRRRTDLDR